MRRFLVAVALMSVAMAAVASEPLAIRVAVYQRLPRLQEGFAPDVQNPDTILTPPAGGWPSSYDGVRRVLSERRPGLLRVMVAEILDPKPLAADASAAFFIHELARPLEVRLAEGGAADVLMPNGQRVSLPVAANATIVLGAKDEQVYVALTFVPVGQLSDDTMVIVNGAKPLRILSRVEPKFPLLEAWRNRSGFVVTQLRIDPDGTVGSVDVLQTIDPQIDAVACDALKQWRFQPPTRNGHPITAYMVFSAPFRIE